MIEKLDSFLVTATRDVFDTMLQWPVETGPAMEGDGQPHTFELLEINGSIGFGGKVMGNLFFSASEALARRIGAQLLGVEVGHAEVSDVVGEITNMIAGGCKSRLCDAGFPVVMSIPNIIRGSQLYAHARDVCFLIRRRFKVAQAAEPFQMVLAGRTN